MCLINQIEMASGSVDRAVLIWNINTCQILKTLRGHFDCLKDLVMLDNRFLASASNDGSLNVWHVATGEIVKTVNCSQSVFCLAVAQNETGAYLAVGSDDGTIKLFN
jgi:WD40 repeat protein